MTCEYGGQCLPGQCPGPCGNEIPEVFLGHDDRCNFPAGGGCTCRDWERFDEDRSQPDEEDDEDEDDFDEGYVGAPPGRTCCGLPGCMGGCNFWAPTEPTTNPDRHTTIRSTLQRQLGWIAPDAKLKAQLDKYATAIVDALGLHNWPHTNQPNNPHTAELRRLREGLASLGWDIALDDDVNPITVALDKLQQTETFRSQMTEALDELSSDEETLLDRARTLVDGELRAQALLGAESETIARLDALTASRDEARAEADRLRAGIQANAAYWTDEAKTLRVTRDKSTKPHRRDRLEAVAMAFDAVAKRLRALLGDNPETAPSATQTAEQTPQADQDTTKAQEPSRAPCKHTNHDLFTNRRLRCRKALGHDGLHALTFDSEEPKPMTRTRTAATTALAAMDERAREAWFAHDDRCDAVTGGGCNCLEWERFDSDRSVDDDDPCDCSEGLCAGFDGCREEAEDDE